MIDEYARLLDGPGRMGAGVLEIVPEAGHNVHQERPDLVNPLLIRFLRGAH